MDQPLTTASQSAGFDFLSGGGEMGRRIREHDWAATSLGEPHLWPQSLKTCIRIMLDSRQPIWIGWGKEWIKLYNDPYLSIIGGKHPWALGKPASEVWADIWEDIAPLLKQVQEGIGTYVESQLLIMERNGYAEETYYTFSYTPVLGDDGRIAGMFCANTDDTERIVSERQLLTLTELGKALLDCRTEKEIIDNTINALTGNPQDFPVALIYNYQQDKSFLVAHTALGAQGSNIPKEIDLSIADEITGLMNLAASTGRMQIVEDIHTKWGDMPKGAWDVSPDRMIILPITQAFSKKPYCFLMVGLNPHRLLDEKYSSFFSLVADQVTTALSDFYAQEQERKRSEALAEIDKAKTAFFTNISHEFRTPLTLMLGTLEEALSDPDTIPRNQQRLDVTHRNAMRLLKLVNTLLDFSRIEASRVKAQFQLTDLAAYTADLASSFRSAIEKAGLTFRVRCDETLPPVYVDREMWEKIVLNLLSNAFKYTLEGSITVSLKAEGDKVLLSVSDTGVGIPEAELPKMFQRFHRVQNITGRTFEGTGIGLSLVKELVLLHGGEISVQSTEGKGSEFTVSIPASTLPPTSEITESGKEELRTSLANAFVEEATSLVEEPLLQKSKERKGDVPTVLIVDDNADMRAYISNLLNQQFNVVTAINGADALQKLAEEKVDLVLSDVMMPVMDGIQLLKTIKQNPLTEVLPVVLVSARAGEEARVEGLDVGADDYLVKPFSARELLARVHSQIALAEKRSHALQSIYSMFDEVPFAVAALKGPELVIEFINRYNLNIWQRHKEDVIGKPLFEARPDLLESASPVHESVYRTGNRFEAREIPIELLIDGIMQTRYFDVIIDPMRDDEGKIVGQLATSIDVTDKVLARKKIQESEHYLRRLTDTVPAIIWITAPDGSCTYLNQHWYEFTGQTLEEAEGFGWLNATHPDDKEEAARVFIQANEQQKPFSLLYRLRTRNGEYRWAKDKGSPRFNSDGVFEGFIGTVADVHEEKQNEAALLYRKALLEAQNEAVPDAVLIVDTRGNILSYNSHFAGLWNIPQQIIEAKDDVAALQHAMMQVSDPQRFIDRVNYCYAHPDEVAHEEILLKDGRIIDRYGNAVVGEDGTNYGWIWYFRDITERKKAEAALRASEDRYQNFIRQSTEGIWRFEVEAPVPIHLPVEEQLTWFHEHAYLAECNDAMAKMYGYDSAEELKGMRLADFFPNDPDTEAYLSYFIQSGYRVENAESKEKDREGNIRYFSNNLIGMVENGYLLRAWGTQRDITAQREAEEKIRYSENRFQNLVREASVGIILLTGNEMKVEIVNEAYGKLIDRTPAELLGRELFTIVPETESLYRPMLEEVMKTGEPLHLYDSPYLICKDGKEREGFLNVVYQPYRNNDGIITGVLALLQDTTESVKAKRALEASEAQFRDFSNNIQNLAWIADENGWIFWYNQRWYDYTGTTLEEMQGWGWEKVHHPDHIERVVDFVKEAWKRPEPFELTFPLRSKTGDYQWFLTRAVPILDEDGKILRWIGTNTNIHEQKLAEEAATKSNERFQLINKATQDAIWDWDLKTNQVLWNEALYQMFGYTAEQVEETAQWWYDHIHPDDRERVVHSIHEVIDAAGKNWTGEYRFASADGSYKTVFDRGFIIHDHTGITIRMLGSMQDITSRKEAEQAIRESESRFRTLANDTPAFLFTADAETNLDFVNRRWLEFVGLKEEEGFGKSWAKVTHPDDVEPMYAIYADAVKNKKPYHFEIRQKNTQGEYRWVLWNGIPRLDAKGDLIGIVGIGIDITEQKRVQELVQASETRFRQMADLVPQILWTARPDGSIDYYNKRWYQYTGVAEDSGSEEWAPFIYPDDQPQMNRVWMSSIHSGKVYQFEFRLREGATGNYRWFIAKAVPVHDSNGNLVKWFGATTDIHEQKLFEETLRESESRFRTLAEALPQMVWMSNEKGEIEYASAEWLQYSGIGDAAKAWAYMIHPEDKQVSEEAYAEAFISGQPFRYELRVRNKDGQYRWHYSVAEPVKDASGRVIKWIGTLTDMHDQKTFTEKLEAEVAQRTKDLQRSNEDLQQFAHVASHDLKEPVRKVRTFSNRLRDEYGSELPEKAKSYLNKVESAASRMYSMIDGVLAYSSLAAVDQVQEQVDLNKILSQIENDLELVISAQRATVYYQRLPVVNGYTLLLHQLFYNLINNSLKFAKADLPPVIRIEAGQPSEEELRLNGLDKSKNWVRLVLTDNGIGFSPAYKDKIFQTFSRLNSKDKYEGTGLGLALCKKIVERHEGAIWAESEEGEGASFIMVLPA